jgi:hypothetical protein
MVCLPYSPSLVRSSSVGGGLLELSEEEMPIHCIGHSLKQFFD